jgi:hypothetical protein
MWGVAGNQTKSDFLAGLRFVFPKGGWIHKRMRQFLMFEAVMITLQFLLFLPFYGIYREDCRQIGKKNLAVPLHERFLV